MIDSSSKSRCLQQERPERIQSADQANAALRRILLLKFVGSPLNIIEEVRDLPMVFLQCVDDWREGRIRATKERKDVNVLAAVMGVYQPAVEQAIHLELPERATGLQLGDISPDCMWRLSVENLTRKSAYDFEVVAQDCVDRQQIAHGHIARKVLWHTATVIDESRHHSRKG